MGEIINLAQYRKQRTRKRHPKSSQPIEPDEIVIRLQPDGTYLADIHGAYAASHLLAIEHLSDLINQFTQTLRRS